MFLIGNKQDLEEKRQVSKETSEKYKEEYGLDYNMECSAKTGYNSKDVFLEATKLLYRDYIKYRSSRSNSFISDNSQSLSKFKEEKESTITIKNKVNLQEPKSEGCC